MLSSLSFFALVLGSEEAGALTVAVAGATGRVGRLVVDELLKREGVEVRALVRDEGKAKAVLPMDSIHCEAVSFTEKEAVARALGDAEVVVWTATGFSDAGSPLSKLKSLVDSLMAKPATAFDAKALAVIGEVATKKKARVICCSSAAVTRPSWSEEKKKRFVGAADIPIVRLNPLDVLNIKLEGEEALRKHAQNYCVVRPTGLNDDWPDGRLVVSQGDLAVGRCNRRTLAAFLADVAVNIDPQLTDGKTFECFALAGYPPPRDYTLQLDRLRTDSEASEDKEDAKEDALDATYALLQQLVPGETLQPNALAMGQTYEQLDRNETGRLGQRGLEATPAFVATK
eukprot:CAMPEP_0118913922 /NCGR_PEP_ID=MMETSP1166-20130328/14506_1 /TAXON_ID=1104430 /ORGANISM="Chrysoreinhardia sp, Strain CCMP3193" /LENGTH=342 /DNA_ID=CAMNT_0006853487 /DNA_START=39 /DNA_END=1067 /DNA_ORIENTATION=-